MKILVEYFDGQVLKENPWLDFHKVINESTGEPKKTSIAFYKDLKFIVYDNGTTIIQGSLHKYFNRGQHNYDDYTYSKLVRTLDELEQKFNLDLSKCRIQNLEVGLNINPPIDTSDLLDCLVLHKDREFKNVSLKGGDYRQVLHSAYYLKAYDKSLQHGLAKIFRWEIKMMRNELMKKLGVRYLSNLLNKKNIERLLIFLIDRWNEILFLDPSIRSNELSGLDYTKMHSWRFKDYWINQRKTYANNKRYLFTKELKEYKEVVKNHSYNLQQQVSDILKAKAAFCLDN